MLCVIHSSRLCQILGLLAWYRMFAGRRHDLPRWHDRLRLLRQCLQRRRKVIMRARRGQVNRSLQHFALMPEIKPTMLILICFRRMIGLQNGRRGISVDRIQLLRAKQGIVVSPLRCFLMIQRT